MKVSYNWLQTYFKEKLPTPEVLEDLLTFHVFEIEGIEKIGDDSVLDVKVLPDRAAYALSHLGIAREIAAITKVQLTDKKLTIEKDTIPRSQELELDIEDDRCIRDTKIVIKNVEVKSSPEWLVEKLKAVGQRSISNMVDATNFVMLDRGQPLHAFDFDKLVKKDGKAKIGLITSKKGQSITTLGGKTYELDDDTLVFVDSNNNDALLDIAGIKGGTLAEVDNTTKNIVILSANFDPGYIRKTSTKYGIRTDASKRSENGISPEITIDGLLQCTQLITEISENKPHIEGIVDFYPKPQEQKKVTVSTDYIVKMLGVNISEPEISDILQRLTIPYSHKEGVFEIISPLWRRDITIPQDIVEEVGRIYSYKKIPATSLPSTTFIPTINKDFYYQNKIRDSLVELGFSEVYTYSLTDTGEVAILNPLASDKNSLRKDLKEGIVKSLELNARNADLLGLDSIKIFEIGKVFTHDKGEFTVLALGVQNIKKSKIKEFQIINEALKALDIDQTSKESEKVFEINLDEIIAKLPEPTESKNYELVKEVIPYKKFSAYPFSVRDIAVFTTEGTEEKEVRDIIEKNAGDLLIRNTLFDRFEKTLPDGTKKTSYGFRMVFQSYERTLTEDEINGVMKAITDSMNAKDGWQVR